jgi:signal transduction histidine kinase
MASLPHRRLLWLFLLVVFLPCAALLTISLRIASQERELSERRRRESRELAVQKLERELLGKLESLRQQELSHWRSAAPAGASYRDSRTVLLGAVVNDRFVPPWEDDAAARSAREQLHEPSFRTLVIEGERAEVARSLDAAAASFQAAAQASRQELQRGYARLLRARALQKAGRDAEALPELCAVLALPSSVRDDYGIPLAWYAAEIMPAAHRQTALGRLGGELRASLSLSPAAFYMLRDLLRGLAEQDAAAWQQVSAELDRRQRWQDRTLALQAEFRTLRSLWSARLGETQAVWLAWGEPVWLLSASRDTAGREMLIAVDAAPIFAEVSSVPGTAAQFVPAAQGQLLGPSFPGLAISLSITAELDGSTALQRSFYWLVALLVVMVALFGTYVLLHGVRRELHLAEMRTQFVSSVSHELKTPLTAIRMFAESLRMGRPAEPAAQAEYLETIISESERLTRLLNNVLDFSQLERGTTRYQLRPVHLQEVVAAAARAVRYPLAQQGFELQTEIDEGLCPVRADADAMQQAVLNLLSNAIKYSGESRRIDLSLHADNGHAVIEVRDHGLGIPPKEQRRIFEKFYRVPSPTVQQIPGTGLGLTLVEHVVAAHGGRVEVESTPGEGSTFRLRMPLEKDV